ncbi:solute:Na+ symporter, SSS family [Zobellia uliginosa]|uniref:Solute:Na+ symporter, SSS family n=1 Tax=Zobellia uliginosa TaxID=143224 RepID=A0ABY1L5M0_9FLAO|nr:sodium:solute symporter family protein [Zobellia uliginosa]SIT08621.1 solute:Na+ symporter, SSS family [Zobellia uliginosa]
MFGLSTIDLVVIVVYFVVIIGIGIRSMLRIKNQEDFFLGGRKFGKIVQIFATFGQATSSDTGPSVGTATFNNGAAGVWANLLMLFSTPLFWFIGPWYRRMRCTTLADFYTERFTSKGLGRMYAIISSIGLGILLSLGFITIIKTVSVMTPKTYEEFTLGEKEEYGQAERMRVLEAKDFTTLDAPELKELTYLRQLQPEKSFSHINKYWLVFIIVVIVAGYSMMGGLEAAFLSDLIQGVFIIFLSIMLVPFAIMAINDKYGDTGVMGALTRMHDNLPESFFEIFGSPYSLDFTWYYIAALSIMAIINTCAQANTFVTPSAAKDEYSARVGLTFGSYLKRITTVLWGFTALLIVFLYADEITDPDKIWGYASFKLLGSVNMGLVGLMIASLMAALMSTAATLMITTSGLLTNNVYRPYFPNKSERHYVAIGRILGSLVIVAAAGITLLNDNLFQIMKLWWEFGVIFSAGFWMGVLWRKTSRLSVKVSIISTFLVFFGIPILINLINPDIKEDPYFLKTTSEKFEIRTYFAKESDVESRKREIAAWETDHIGDRPEELIVGQEFVKKFKLPSKSIFWSTGIKIDKKGKPVGTGMINPELLLLDKMGFALENNSYSLNETLRILIRMSFPFILIILISSIFPRKEDEEYNIKRFYAKMKTPVGETKEEDEMKLEWSYAHMKDCNATKLFGPDSNWEFTRWDRTDGIGFIAACGFVLVVLALLYFLVNLGG